MSLFNGLFAHLRSRAAVRLLVVLVVALGAVGWWQAPALAQQGRLDPAPDQRVAAIEMDFLMGMIPHHRGALMMSEMALQKASRPEVRELARENIASQTREIGLMTNWLRDWYGMTPPPGTMMPKEIMDRMDMPMMRGLMPGMEEQMERMKYLETLSGPAFDVEYMSQLTDHHGMAIMMSAPVLIRGHHAALYELAGGIAKEQGEQIQEMRDYLDRFYGVARPLTVRR